MNEYSLHSPTSMAWEGALASREAFLRSTQGRVQAKGLSPSSMLHTLAVPAGRTPSAVSVPTRPLTTLPIVPSPPTANTASFFSAAACFASSTVCGPL